MFLFHLFFLFSASFQDNCPFEEWNQVNQKTYRNQSIYSEWSKTRRLQMQEGVPPNSLQLVSAFVYSDFIAITTTYVGYKNVGSPVRCRYFDCHRKELRGSTFATTIFPIAVAHCARRANAKFVTLSFENSTSAEDPEPIPLIFRAFSNPPHELAVCSGQFFGREPKWIEVIEHVEHHIMLGATQFYFTILDVSKYDNRIFIYYDRHGISETTTYLLDYNATFQFHELQQNDCFYRSRQHAKWVINIDIDERFFFTPKNIKFIDFLRRIPENYGELSFAVARIVKNEMNIEKNPENPEELEENLLFLKYKNITNPEWYGIKGIFKPLKIHLLFYHFAYGRDEGSKIYTILPEIGYAHHYRSSVPNMVASNWINNYKEFKKIEFDDDYLRILKKRVMNTIQRVYTLKTMRCEDVSYPKIYDMIYEGSCVWKNGTRINK
ncbi:unnamed protein product [Caenorhabditis angaria]|uniref:Glycosyltransferase family 92 protein n=1 Tax=Caenorhabditis angaria TaxID=860376 RepID=A0A9P1IAP3_9PELO|nr:unnamed protein product [Caenorhabditis angaria]